MAITEINTPKLFDFSTQDNALQLPTGTTAERPLSPVTGQWRFNTTKKYVEYWDGNEWFSIDTEAFPLPNNFPNQHFNTSTYFGTGATQTIDAKFNEAANFDGSSSKIDLPNLGISGAATRTISAWINVNSLSAAQTIFQFGNSAAKERFGFAIDTSGKLYVEYYGRDVITSSAQITTGSWFNVAVVYNGGVIETATNTQIYVNGSAVAMSTTSGSTGVANTGDSNYGIGYRRPSTSQYFNGKIDQVRIFNTALPATGTASVATLYTETTTTAATLNFPAGAECVATYQLDGNGDGVEGAINRSATATYQLNSDGSSIPSNTYPLTTNGITFASGKFGNAAGFSSGNASTGDYMKVSNSIYGSSTTVFSWSLWIKCDNTTGTGINIMGNGGLAVGQTGYTVYLYNGRLALSTLQSSDQYFPNPESNGTLINDNQWHNIVLTYNNGSFVLYLDGSPNQTGTSSNYIDNATPANDTYIGNSFQRGISDGIVNGQIDQVRVFGETILNQNAVTALYNETTTTAQNASIEYQSGPYSAATTNIGYTGLNFGADLVWIKSRSNSTSHELHDSVRGEPSRISSDLTDAAYANYNGFVAITSNGFSLDGAGTGGEVNTSGRKYVAWSFKAGGNPTTDNVAGAGAIPTSGSVQINGADLGTALAGTTAATRLSANTNTGLSIVKFPATNTNINVAHGLNSEPELIIWKNLDTADNWYVYSKYLSSPTTEWLYLNYNYNAASSSPYGFSAVTASTFTSYLWAGAGTNNILSYCFHSINGYQRVGTYTGDGNTSGNFIYTTSDGTASGTNGFEPAFLLIKNINTTGTSWLLYDNKRTPTNPIQTALIANSNQTDTTTSAFKINFFTNGFEVTGTGSDINGSGDTFIYLAIAADKDTSVPTLANSFSPTIYTGNGSTQRIFTPFAPDFTWIKGRNGATESHVLNDIIRGVSTSIYSNTQGSEYFASNLYNTSFNSDGFTVGDNAAGNYGVNGSTSPGMNYVAWSWKAGGLPTINNDGSTKSIVSVNQAAGFSIVRYRGDNTANQTIGHGLGTGNIPKLMIIKKFTGTSDWVVYSADLTNATYVLNLNNANQENNNNNAFNGTAPTDEVFTVKSDAGNVNDNGQDMIAYCFADVSGYQSIGSYSGNTTTNPVISTGFSPSFVVIKQINGSNPWVVIDSARAPSNPASCRLRLNATDAEYCNSAEAINRSGTGFEVASNWDGMNGNGNTYLYWAIK